MKILAVTNMYPTEKDPAFGVFVRSQMDSVASLGHTVRVEAIRAHGNPLAYLRAAWRISALVRQFVPDVVHAHYGLTGAACAWAGAPLVVSFCGDDLLGTPDGRRGYTVKSRVGIRLSRIAARRADGIICKSRGLVEALPAAQRARAHVVPNGVDTSLFHPGDRAAARAALGIDLAERLIIFPHALAQKSRKRFDLAEAAAADLAARGVRARLWIVNGIPQVELPLYYQAADCMLLTSDHEGSPNTVKEALCCDLPVVTVDAGDASQQISEVPGCYLVERRPAAIAAAIARVLSGPGRVDASAARRRLSLEVIARRVVAVYQEAIAQRAGAAARSRST